MRKLLPLLLLGGALAACQDEMPLAPRVTPADAPTRNVVTVQPAEWRGYWRNDKTLWVYDMTPEVGMHSARGVPQDYNRIHDDLGMRIVRYPVDWRKYRLAALAGCYPYGDGGDGCYSTGLDNAEGYARAGGKVKLMVEVYSWPEDVGNLPIPQRYQAFAAFMDTLVRRYPQVPFWQIGNEQDAGTNSDPFYNTGSLDACTGDRTAYGIQYAEMLRYVYPAIKAANPNAWVVTGGLTGTEGFEQFSNAPESGYCGDSNLPAKGGYPSHATTWTFLNGMYQGVSGNGRDYFDILAVHAYGTTPTSSYSFQQTGQSFVAAVAQNGDVNRPIWMTEFGAGAGDVSQGGVLLTSMPKSAWRAFFDQKQLEWWQGALSIHASEQSIQKIIGFTFIGNSGGCLFTSSPATNFNVDSGDPDCIDYGYTLLHNDTSETHRPVYDWLASRKSLSMQAESIGARTGPFTIWMNSEYWRVPAEHAFTYSNGSYIVRNVTVNTLYPAAVKFINPIAAQASSWNSITPPASSWLPETANGYVVGTVGQNRPLEAIRVRRVELPADIDINYALDVQSNGWIAASNGATAGTVGQGNATHQVKMWLTDPQNRGWHICYEAHVAGTGWLPEQCDGVPAGVPSSHLEAVRIYLKKS